MPDPRSYPPIETQAFLTCPTLWWLGKQGYFPRAEPEWTPNRLIGSAVQAGLSQWYKLWVPGGVLGVPDSVTQAAYAVVEAEYVEQDTWTLETLKGLVSRGLDLGVKGPQLEGMGTVVLGEQDVYGRRPDVVWRTTEGKLVVDDNKVVLSLDPKWQGSRLAEFEHSWQLRDYAYHVGEYFCEEVALTRINLMILGPRKRVVLHEVPQSKARLAKWYESAQQVWAAMARVEAGESPWQNLQGCTNKGLHFGQRCWGYDFCHTFHGDPILARTLYEQKPKHLGGT